MGLGKPLDAGFVFASKLKNIISSGPLITSAADHDKESSREATRTGKNQSPRKLSIQFDKVAAPRPSVGPGHLRLTELKPVGLLVGRARLAESEDVSTPDTPDDSGLGCDQYCQIISGI